MKFGISLPCRGDLPTALTDAFERAAQLGFDHVELRSGFIDGITRTRSMEFVHAVRRAARGRDLTYSCHLASPAAVLLDTGRFDVEGLQRYFFALNVTRLVKAVFVAMKPFPLGECRDADAIALAYHALMQHAHEQRVPLAVVLPPDDPTRYPHTLDEVQALADAVDDLHLLLDTGRADREVGDTGIEGYIAAFGDRVLGVHVHDTHDAADLPLPVALRRLVDLMEQRRIDVPWILDDGNAEVLRRRRTRRRRDPGPGPRPAWCSASYGSLFFLAFFGLSR